MISKEELNNALKNTGYCTNKKTLDTLWVSLLSKRPLILEGEPGVGKTSIAKALADAFDLHYSRIQMYEGLTDDRILYDYDYQKMLIIAELEKDQIQQKYQHYDINNAIEKMGRELNFFGEEFILKRPILSSITNEKRTVLCIDELDKASEETEYMLYEFLEDYSITIPQYGTIRARKNREPIVFITSNGYRELSSALRRRCGYLYIPQKTKAELTEILMTRVRISEKLATAVAECFAILRKSPLRKQPSVSEAIDLAQYLASCPGNITTDFVLSALSIICKNQRDEENVKKALNEMSDAICGK